VIILYKFNCGVRVVVFNATFNDISVISKLSVVLLEETGVPEENYFYQVGGIILSIVPQKSYVWNIAMTSTTWVSDLNS
jgi:hypothetical protein